MKNLGSDTTNEKRQIETECYSWVFGTLDTLIKLSTVKIIWATSTARYAVHRIKVAVSAQTSSRPLDTSFRSS